MELTHDNQTFLAYILQVEDNFCDVLKHERTIFAFVLKKMKKLTKVAHFLWKYHHFYLKIAPEQPNRREFHPSRTFFILHHSVVIFFTNPFVLRQNRCFRRVIMKGFAQFSFVLIFWAHKVKSIGFCLTFLQQSPLGVHSQKPRFLIFWGQKNEKFAKLFKIL